MNGQFNEHLARVQEGHKEQMEEAKQGFFSLNARMGEMELELREADRRVSDTQGEARSMVQQMRE